MRTIVKSMAVSFPIAKRFVKQNTKENQAKILTPICQNVIDDSITVDDFFEFLNKELSCRYLSIKSV